jgi:flavorubredoxin
MVLVKKDIWWVGYVDWNLRNFHGYSTPSGSSYNAYLILDEKPTLIDTVKHYGYEDMLSRIKALIHPSKIQYIISNHSEMDHSGSIEKLLTLCPEAEVVCSPSGEENLRKHFRRNWHFKVVKTGDSLSIGKRTLDFFSTPMVHWPDSMITYLNTDKVLFPNDAFGQHYASYERFAEEVGQDIVFKEAAKYYANIIMPYGNQVAEALGHMQRLPIDMICPSHGLIWRQKTEIDTIVELYNRWAHYETEERAVIIYDTMWHSTEKMAFKLLDILDKEEIPVKLCNLQTTDISDAMTDILRAKFILVGTPILNNRIFPTIGGFLTYVKGLKPKSRFFSTFGSYGWSKAGFKELEDGLKEAGMQPIGEGRYFQFVPEDKDLDSLKDVVAKIQNIISGK